MNLIVPPTWAKGVHRKIAPIWKNAYQILLNSTHIRILGYSLSESDSYIKYLLKSAATKSPHLKSIDVICLDHENTIKDRYDEFIKFNYYRFRNFNIKNYLEELAELQNKTFRGTNK